MTKDNLSWIRGLGLLPVMVITLVGFTLGGAGIGYLAWKKLGVPDWTLVIMGLLGFGLGVYRVYQISREEMALEAEESQEPSEKAEDESSKHGS